MMLVGLETAFSSQFHISSMEWKSCIFKFDCLRSSIEEVVQSFTLNIFQRVLGITTFIACQNQAHGVTILSSMAMAMLTVVLFTSLSLLILNQIEQLSLLPIHAGQRKTIFLGCTKAGMVFKQYHLKTVKTKIA